MGALKDRAKKGHPIFAPIVFRLAMRLEQVDWTEISESPSEAVFVLRSVEQLFKLDALCPSFDPWLEAEAAGVPLQRDDLGYVVEARRRTAKLPLVGEVVEAQQTQNALEVVNRLSTNDGALAPPLASITVGASLLDRLRTDADDDSDLPEYCRELTLALARRYLDAGAAGLLLLQDRDDPELVDIKAFEGLFNLGAYYDVPVLFVSCTSVGEKGLQALKSAGAEHYLTPDAKGDGVCAIEDEANASSAWFASTRWETDPATEPDTIHNWRHAVVGD
ncbi:MAG: hypothetical protein AAF636_04455 [Pseudomonadota bacterium]